MNNYKALLDKLYKKLYIWRLRKIQDRHFILILSFIIGLASGLAAVLLKNTVHYTYKFITDSTWFSVDQGNFLYLAYPMIGMAFTVLFVTYIVKDDISHGVSKVLYAISRKKGSIKKHHTYSSMIASTITVAFGGSVGLEAPIVTTGSALGSNIARFFRLSYKHKVLLIGCGAAGAVAGIFKAPIAGIVFVIEVLMLDLTMTTMLPLLISSITASLLGYFFLGSGAQFSFKVSDGFHMSQIPFYMILGLFASAVSLYFLRTLAFVEKRFGKIKRKTTKILTGGIILGVLIFLFPPLFGEGYESLTQMLNGEGADLLKNSFFYFLKDNQWAFLGILLLIIIFKAIATASTTAGGGVGGTFAPSLFLGGVSGFFVASLINTTGIGCVSVINFSLVGMAAVMTGVMQAPLTGIFLIAEITGGYELFTPLMIASTISYLAIQPFEKESVYTKKLAAQGDLITHNKDKSAFLQMTMKKLIEDNFVPVNINGTLGDLIKAIEVSKRNLFPVLDNNRKFRGVVLMDDIRSIMFKTEMYHTCMIKDIMLPYADYYIVDITDSIETVVHKFRSSNQYNIAVLDNGYYKGFVSKANTFQAYRKFISEFSEE